MGWEDIMGCICKSWGISGAFQVALLSCLYGYSLGVY